MYIPIFGNENVPSVCARLRHRNRTNEEDWAEIKRRGNGWDIDVVRTVRDVPSRACKVDASKKKK